MSIAATCGGEVRLVMNQSAETKARKKILEDGIIIILEKEDLLPEYEIKHRLAYHLGFSGVDSFGQQDIHNALMRMRNRGAVSSELYTRSGWYKYRLWSATKGKGA